jgi:hypothetical protein
LRNRPDVAGAPFAVTPPAANTPPVFSPQPYEQPRAPNLPNPAVTPTPNGQYSPSPSPFFLPAPGAPASPALAPSPRSAAPAGLAAPIATLAMLGQPKQMSDASAPAAAEPAAKLAAGNSVDARPTMSSVVIAPARAQIGAQFVAEFIVRTDRPAHSVPLVIAYDPSRLQVQRVLARIAAQPNQATAAVDSHIDAQNGQIYLTLGHTANATARGTPEALGATGVAAVVVFRALGPTGETGLSIASANVVTAGGERFLVQASRPARVELGQ